MYKNTGIIKQSIFYLIKRFDISSLTEKLTEESDKKLTHNGFRYIETDESYKNAIAQSNLGRILRKKRMRLTVIHAGHITPPRLKGKRWITFDFWSQ